MPGTSETTLMSGAPLRTHFALDSRSVAGLAGDAVDHEHVALAELLDHPAGQWMPCGQGSSELRDRVGAVSGGSIVDEHDTGLERPLDRRAVAVGEGSESMIASTPLRIS